VSESRNETTVPSRVLILGATSGIAIALARLLTARGASFFLVARDPEKLRAVEMDLKTRGAASVESRVMDLNDTANHPALLADAAHALGVIDLSFLAHGILGNQAETESSFPAAAAVLETNLLSAASLITWLANYFEARGEGTLAVLSSVAGDRGRRSNYVYGASKAGLNTLMAGVRNRIDRSGVNVLTIKPGWVDTPMTAGIDPNPLFVSPQRAARGILRAIVKRKDVVYVPRFWAVIMFVVRSLPESLFKRLNY
jgi:decaprenylphospho-beta-D-erythro-pentofuranosid-2-ulose 2-reductase